MKGDVRMGDLVNLRQARKQKKRSAKEKQADANRALHGRTRGERTKKDAEDRKADRQHDGHYRGAVPPTDDTKPGETDDDIEAVKRGEGDGDSADDGTGDPGAASSDKDNVVSFFRAANPNSKPDND